MGRCPFHTEKTPSFTVNDQKAFYHCFGCGAHGNIFDFLQYSRRLTFREAVIDAAQRAGVILPQNFFKTSSTPQQKENATILEILSKTTIYFQERLHSFSGTEARTYLKDLRGFTSQTLDHFQIGYAEKGDGQRLISFLQKEGYCMEDIRTAGLVSSSEDRSLERDKFRNRIIFPILNLQQQVIGFGGRLLGEGLPKYLNSPETPVFKKGAILYNFIPARSTFSATTPLIVVEGYTDVMRLFQHGISPAVAPLGTALTSDHLSLMWKYYNEPLLCFDGDEAGQRAAERASEKALALLKPGKTISFVTLPSSEDPDTLVRHMGGEAFKKHLASSIPLADFLWTSILKKYPRALPEEKALVTKTLDTWCATITDSSIQSYYKQMFRDKCYQWGRRSYSSQPKEKKDLTLSARPPTFEPMDILYEKILIGAFMHHPDLLEPLHEELALLSLKIPLHIRIQEKLVSCFFTITPIEKDSFASYLKECGLDTFRDLVARELRIHAPSLENSSLDHKIDTWRSIHTRWIRYHSVDRDLNEAKQQLESDWTPSSWERYKALKKALVLNEDETTTH